MMATKQKYGKLGGNVAYHGYQSFREGEVTPEEAHIIGLETAKQMWGDYEVVVTTHLNTDNIHNHFVVNSVSFKTGKKFENHIRDHRRLREISDLICFDYGKSFLTNAPFYSNEKKFYWLRKNRGLSSLDKFREDADMSRGYARDFYDYYGTIDTTKRIRYACYGKTRKQTDCDGQSGYTMHILDDLIDEIVRDIFKKLKGVSKNDVVKLRYSDELELRKARLTRLKTDYTKETDNLSILKSEVVKAIKGESSFSTDILSTLISEAEEKCNNLFNLCKNAEKEVNDTQAVLRDLSDSFDELISWAELYDEASFEKKKMIVNCLIKRVDVYRDYKLKIDFNFNFEQFVVGLDKTA